MTNPSPARTKRRRLQRADWERAALDAIAARGLAAVAVEPLARELGVTKGSFYAHFANHDELIDAALARWEREHSEASLRALAGVAEPLDQLRTLFETAVSDSQSRPQSPHLALLGELHDQRVRAVLRRVSLSRISFLVDIYRRLGLSPARARDRARLAYAAYVGLLQLGRLTPGDERTPRTPAGLLAEINTTYLAGLGPEAGDR